MLGFYQHFSYGWFCWLSLVYITGMYFSYPWNNWNCSFLFVVKLLSCLWSHISIIFYPRVLNICHMILNQIHRGYLCLYVDNGFFLFSRVRSTIKNIFPYPASNSLNFLFIIFSLVLDTFLSNLCHSCRWCYDSLLFLNRKNVMR